MEKIITRFAPSPTGYLHVGGARTALFNWLYARHNNGTFILRIEDTDIKRSTKESVDAIFEAFKWLDIDYDDGPYFQSERYELYKEYLQKLIESENAYYCDCSPEKLDNMRELATKLGKKPKYDGTCRNKGLKPGKNTVIRFKSPTFGNTTVKDMVKGNITFNNEELDDFIIQRSDGSLTYNFVVVIDDLTMKINTVIRGDDHVNNTPKQILLYNALNSKLPDFAHVPMVLGPDRSRLSKRHGAMSVTAYRDMGYLSEAFINYLVRIGWSYGDQEFFTKNDLIEKFTLKNIGHSAGIFDQAKLLALNAEHIKKASTKMLSLQLIPFLKQNKINIPIGSYTENVIKTLNTRSKTLKEMSDSAIFYYQEKVVYEEKASNKFLKNNILEPLTYLEKLLADDKDFTQESIENAFKQTIENFDIKFGKIAQPVRVALTGKTVSPGIFEIIEVLGKEKTVLRLKDAIEHIKNKN